MIFNLLKNPNLNPYKSKKEALRNNRNNRKKKLKKIKNLKSLKKKEIIAAETLLK